jgi:hypothetical protein
VQEFAEASGAGSCLGDDDASRVPETIVSSAIFRRWSSGGCAHPDLPLLARHSAAADRPGGLSSVSQVSTHAYVANGDAPAATLKLARRTCSLTSSGMSLSTL